MQDVWLFKLSNSIKDEHEIRFAELELFSLHGKVEWVRNFSDITHQEPISLFCDEKTRLQDVLMYEPPYGPCQGFISRGSSHSNLQTLSSRLSYTREIYLITQGSDCNETLARLFPGGRMGYNVSVHTKKDTVLLRIVTNQYYLEKSSYISKLSRNKDEVDRNCELLFKYPFDSLYRIPASATMAVGKRLQDYFTIREEGSLYLTHIWHPYKAKFHPRMVRAILNYLCPEDDAVVMDNWAGSGTMNVESTLMGMNNIGLEINPLSALMSTVKCQAYHEDYDEINSQCLDFLSLLKIRLMACKNDSKIADLHQFDRDALVDADAKLNRNEDDREVAAIKKVTKAMFTEVQIREFICTRSLIEETYSGFIRHFLLLGLSGTISDLARRRDGEVFDVFSSRLSVLMCLRMYLFEKLNETLNVTPGKSATYISDNRSPFDNSVTIDHNKVALQPGSVDAIVTSPPYSTAVDYIKNDLPQLTILKLVEGQESMAKLERSLEGNPNPRAYRDQTLAEELDSRSGFFLKLPSKAVKSIEKLVDSGRKQEALRSYKFFRDMHASLQAISGLLRKGGKCAIVIGNNHYKLEGDIIEEVENDSILFELAISPDIGLIPDPHTEGVIKRPLEKTLEGYIREESVLILKKA